MILMSGHFRLYNAHSYASSGQHSLASRPVILCYHQKIYEIAGSSSVNCIPIHLNFYSHKRGLKFSVKSTYYHPLGNEGPRHVLSPSDGLGTQNSGFQSPGV